MQTATTLEITLLNGCSPVNVLHIFTTPLPGNTSGWLLLSGDVQVINIQSCGYVSLCHPAFGNCRIKNNNGNENNYTNNNNDNEKETRYKTELKESPQKGGKEKRAFILRDNNEKHVNDYEIRQKLDNGKVYMKSFSGTKIKCMGIMFNQAQPTMRANPDHIVIHV